MTSYDYSDNYPTCVETYSSLRIYSYDLHSDQITRILGLEPEKAFSKGDTFGKKTKRQRKCTGWFYSTENSVKSRDTRRHLDEILNALAGKDEAINDLMERGCKVDITSFWVSVGHGGPIIEHEQMRRLADLKISIWWDVYFDDGNDDDKLR